MPNIADSDAKIDKIYEEFDTIARKLGLNTQLNDKENLSKPFYLTNVIIRFKLIVHLATIFKYSELPK